MSYKVIDMDVAIMASIKWARSPPVLLCIIKRLVSLVGVHCPVNGDMQPYSSVMAWFRSRISFNLLRYAIMNLRGARS